MKGVYEMVEFSAPLIYSEWRTRQRSKKRLKQPNAFLGKLAKLLSEGYTFYDSLHMLAPHHMTNEETSLAHIKNLLKEGHPMTTVFFYFGVSSRYLLTLQLAEQRGEFHRALEHVAAQMDRQTKNNQMMLKLLTYPFTLFFLLVFLLIGFRQFFLPQMSTMFSTTTSHKTWIELTISRLLLHLPDVFIALFSMVAVAIAGAVIIGSRRDVAAQLSFIYRIYPLRLFFQLMFTKQLAEEIGTLLTSGLSLQDALTILKQQTYQPYIRYLATHLYTFILRGQLLSEAVKEVPYFQRDFASCIMHGERGGNLGRELIMYGELIATKQQQLVNRLLGIVQPLFFCLIAVCILGAYLAILLPMYQMIDFV